MNERIRELAEQCTTINDSTTIPVDKDFDAEKFAELIVDEVYSYINNATLDDEPFPSRKDVKQHFGVEE